MSVQVNTAGSTGYIGRSSNVVNYNSAYTVLFSVYQSATFNYDTWWTISGTTGSNGGTQPGTRSDTLKSNGAGTSIKLTLWDGTNGDETVIFSPSVGWHNIAIVRSSATAIKVRYNATNSSTLTMNVGSRESVLTEFFGWDSYSGNSQSGVRFTNYKCWAAALSDAEIDAEHATTSFIVTANKVTGSPMGDAATLAGNLTADGSGSAWTAGAGMTYGANNPGVTYTGGSVSLAGAASAGATASATLSVQRNLAASAVAGALASGGLSVNKALTAAAIGQAVGVAALQVFSQVWRVPTNAPNGASVFATVYAGIGGARVIVTQGLAVVAGGYIDLPGSGTPGVKALMHVDNYNDNTATVSIRGGPAIATLTSI